MVEKRKSIIRYTRDEMLSFRSSCMEPSKSLPKGFNTADGLFSPDEWIQHLWKTEGVESRPTTRKKPLISHKPLLDNAAAVNASDPLASTILSPQRRGFSSGCRAPLAKPRKKGRSRESPKPVDFSDKKTSSRPNSRASKVLTLEEIEAQVIQTPAETSTPNVNHNDQTKRDTVDTKNLLFKNISDAEFAAYMGILDISSIPPTPEPIKKPDISTNVNETTSLAASRLSRFFSNTKTLPPLLQKIFANASQSAEHQSPLSNLSGCKRVEELERDIGARNTVTSASAIFNSLDYHNSSTSSIAFPASPFSIGKRVEDLEREISLRNSTVPSSSSILNQFDYNHISTTSNTNSGFSTIAPFSFCTGAFFGPAGRTIDTHLNALAAREAALQRIHFNDAAATIHKQFQQFLISHAVFVLSKYPGSNPQGFYYLFYYVKLDPVQLRTMVERIVQNDPTLLSTFMSLRRNYSTAVAAQHLF